MARNSFGQFLGLVMSLVVALFFLWAFAPVWGTLFNVVPQPESTAISTYSTFLDATEVAAIIGNIIVVVGGTAATKDLKVTLAIIGILFVAFLLTGL